jgi:hypothetical protein
MTSNIKQKIQEILRVLEYYHCSDIGLFTGQTGISLFELLFAEQEKNENITNRAITRIENIFDLIEKDTNPSATFCSGLAGLHWLLNYVNTKQLLTIKPSLRKNAERYLEYRYPTPRLILIPFLLLEIVKQFRL